MTSYLKQLRLKPMLHAAQFQLETDLICTRHKRQRIDIKQQVQLFRGLVGNTGGSWIFVSGETWLPLDKFPPRSPNWIFSRRGTDEDGLGTKKWEKGKLRKRWGRELYCLLFLLSPAPALAYPVEGAGYPPPIKNSELKMYFWIVFAQYCSYSLNTKFLEENFKNRTKIFHIASASGEKVPQVPHLGFASGPYWGTSVPRLPSLALFY